MARSRPIPVRRALVSLAALAGLLLSTAASCSGTNADASTPGTSCTTSTRNSNGGTTRTVYQKCTSYGSRTASSTTKKTTTTATTTKKHSSKKSKHDDDDDS